MVAIREGGKIKMRLFTIDAICMQMKILFSFPPFIGHLNPSLPIAKALVERGHEVHFISTTEVKEKIINETKIDTSNFYCTRSIHEEFYKGISLDNTSPLAPMEAIFSEFNLPKTEFVSQLMCHNIELERKLHDTIKLMQALNADIVIYDALIRGRDAMYAARILGFKSVGQFSLAGAGRYAEESCDVCVPNETILVLCTSYVHISNLVAGQTMAQQVCIHLLLRMRVNQ